MRIAEEPCRDRRRETLFIDARQMGALVDRTHKELGDEDITRIAGAHHAWRREQGAGDYEDVPGFCKSTTEHGFVLTSGRYVGAAASEEDDEPVDGKMKRLTAELAQQFAEGRRLEEESKANLESIGRGCTSCSCRWLRVLGCTCCGKCLTVTRNCRYLYT